MTRCLIVVLLRLYPAAWRREYGAELDDLLSARGLDARTVADVAWNGARQRVRTTGLPTWLGLVAMVVVGMGVLQNLLDPAAAALGAHAVLEDSGITWPVVTLGIVQRGWFPVVLIGAGMWAGLRRRVSAHAGGRAAVRVALIAGLPVVGLGLALVTGLIDLRIVDASATRPDVTALTYTYVTPAARSATPFTILAAPLFALPLCFVYGVVGGLMCRAIPAGRQRRVAR